MTFIERLIEEAKASLSDNPHKIRSHELALALATLVGRRQAVEKIAESLATAAADVLDSLKSPSPRVSGHAFADQPYSKTTTCCAVANLRSSVEEVVLCLDRFNAEKRAHAAGLRAWAEAA